MSTAVPSDNPERLAAEARDIPIVARGQMLAELTKTRRTVAIVGAHGKTTTSSMVAVDARCRRSGPDGRHRRAR